MPAILKGRIYQVIHEHGPMLYEDLAKYITDVPLDRIRWCIQEDRRKGTKRVFRVEDWKRNIGVRGQPSPIIGLGNESDTPMPDLTEARKEAADRYNAEMSLSRPEQRLSKEERETIRAGKRAERDESRNQETQATVRSACVFASMLAPAAPIEIKGARARQFRTSNIEPTTNAKTKTHVSANLSVTGSGRTPRPTSDSGEAV